jgi:hypothetical protein
MENKNLTAVEWLENELIERYCLVNSESLFQKAKEMEKQQIIDACVNFGNLNEVGIEDFEQYYNETFGK